LFKFVCFWGVETQKCFVFKKKMKRKVSQSQSKRKRLKKTKKKKKLFYNKASKAVLKIIRDYLGEYETEECTECSLCECDPPNPVYSDQNCCWDCHKYIDEYEGPDEPCECDMPTETYCNPNTCDDCEGYTDDGTPPQCDECDGTKEIEIVCESYQVYCLLVGVKSLIIE
jgi:hypothetical protein